MDLLEALTTKLKVVREKLAPFYERLEELQKTAPVEEMRQAAAELHAELSKSLAEGEIAVHETARIVAQQQDRLDAAIADADKAIAEMNARPAIKSKAELRLEAFRAKLPKATNPFTPDTEFWEQLRKDLLIYVDVEKPTPDAKSADHALAFHDWANESVLAGGRLPHADSSVVARISDETIAGTPTPSPRPLSSFESWLHESVRLSRVVPAAADARQTNWFKLFSASETPPTDGASKR